MVDYNILLIICDYTYFIKSVVMLWDSPFFIYTIIHTHWFKESLYPLYLW